MMNYATSHVMQAAEQLPVEDHPFLTYGQIKLLAAELADGTVMPEEVSQALREFVQNAKNKQRDGASIGPSASHRVQACPASHILEKYSVEPLSDAAKDGAAVHASIEDDLCANRGE